jgi:hypothetical protein
MRDQNRISDHTNENMEVVLHLDDFIQQAERKTNRFGASVLRKN